MRAPWYPGPGRVSLLCLLWAAPTSSFGPFLCPCLRNSKFRNSENQNAENQNMIFRANRSPAQNQKTKSVENASCKAYRAYLLFCAGTSRHKNQKCTGHDSEMVFPEPAIGLSEVLIFRARVFRAEAEKGRGWGHPILAPLRPVQSVLGRKGPDKRAGRKG